MIYNEVQFGNILYVFERFGELHFLPTFKAWSFRLRIAIVKSDTSRLFGYSDH